MVTIYGGSGGGAANEAGIGRESDVTKASEACRCWEDPRTRVDSTRLASSRRQTQHRRPALCRVLRPARGQVLLFHRACAERSFCTRFKEGVRSRGVGEGAGPDDDGFSVARLWKTSANNKRAASFIPVYFTLSLIHQ